jgi:hypothetical protein
MLLKSTDPHGRSYMQWNDIFTQEELQHAARCITRSYREAYVDVVARLRAIVGSLHHGAAKVGECEIREHVLLCVAPWRTLITLYRLFYGRPSQSKAAQGWLQRQEITGAMIPVQDKSETKAAQLAADRVLALIGALEEEYPGSCHTDHVIWLLHKLRGDFSMEFLLTLYGIGRAAFDQRTARLKEAARRDEVFGRSDLLAWFRMPRLAEKSERRTR